LAVLRRQVAKFPLRLLRVVRGRRPVRIVVRIGARTRHGVRLVRAASLRISRSTVRPIRRLRWFRRILRLLALLLLLLPRLSFWRRMLLGRKIRAPALRHRRRYQYCAEAHRQQISCELESKSHQLHRLILAVVLLLILVLIRIAVARVLGLHRLRQIRQCSEIRKHIKILQHW